MRVLAAALVLALNAAHPVSAETVSVAVAANFTVVAEQLAEAFSSETGDEVQLSFGATGQLYAQITQGAPFQILLAADDERPSRAVSEGFGVQGTVFTYAIGELVLYGPSLDLSDGEAVLRAGNFERLAIADPEAAPYGAAAMEVLSALGVEEAIRGRLVTGESITQTLQFIESGSAELGFVGASQVAGASEGAQWRVPSDLYQPIRQDAVLLKTGENSPAARAFFDYLKSDAAAEIITGAGYAVDRP